MNFKHYRNILNLLYIIMLGLLAAALLLPRGGYTWPLFGAALGAMVIQTLFRFKFWRCPNCKTMLKKSSTPQCPACGWKQELK